MYNLGWAMKRLFLKRNIKLKLQYINLQPIKIMNKPNYNQAIWKLENNKFSK